MAARTYYPRCRVVLDVLLEDYDDGTTGESFTYEATPRRADWTRNDLRTADEFKIELDYRDFPLDPRTVRAIGVAIYCGDIGDPDAVLDLNDETVQVFFGSVDEPQAALSEGGETVTLDGRDHTAIFLGQEWSGGAIDIDRPLIDVIEEVRDAAPGGDDLEVDMDLAAYSVNLATLTGKTKWSPQGKDDTWTVLVELCGLAGLIPVVELDTLRVVAPGDLTAQQAAFLYGENVERLEFRRRLTERHSQRVQLTCWDPQARESRQVLYPAEPLVTRRRLTPKGKVVTDPESVIAWTVQGSYTEDQLKELAQAYFEEMALPDVQGVLETKDLTDLDQATALPRLANGDTVTVQLGAIRADISDLSEGEAVTLLSSGAEAMPEAAAQALVSAWGQAQDLGATFYVRAVRHSWSRESGYSAEIEFESQSGAPT